MFSVITNIYNKKTKGPTLMKLFTATGKLKKIFFFFFYRDVSMFAPRMTQHTSIRYSSSYHTHVNMSASRFFTAAIIRAFRSARSRKRVLCVLCTKCTLYGNHRLTRLILKDSKRHPLPNTFSGQPFSHYIHSHRLAAEMWTTMKNNLPGKNFLNCSFYIYRFRKYVSYGFSYNKFL
jgi:hypothetical protein